MTEKKYDTNIIKTALGVSLDELGIGLVNVGSVSFEYIASLFSEERIQRSCAIVTDEDVQIVEQIVNYIRQKQRREERIERKSWKLYMARSLGRIILCATYLRG